MASCHVCGRTFDKGATGVCPECSHGDNDVDPRPNMIPWNPKWDEEEDEDDS